MRVARTAFLPVSLLVLFAAGSLVPLPAFIESPGTLLSLGGCVVVELPDTDPVDGDYLLTSVTIGRATPFELVAAAFAPDRRIEPATQVLPPGTDAEEYFARQRDVFRIAGQQAAAVALGRAGYEVPTRAVGDGVLVSNVLSGFPAEGVLRPGDVITAVEGTRVRSAEELQDTVVDTDPLSITLERDGEELQVEVAAALREVGDVQPRPVLGIEIQTLNPRLDLPVPVDIESGRIGGPSAGLMIALTVYDKIAPENLSAGRRVAGTGTIDSEGTVGPIGGVGLKALAAYRDGADVFLAPAAQEEEAASLLPADAGMEVVGVGTLGEAIDALDNAEPGSGQPDPPPDCALAA